MFKRLKPLVVLLVIVFAFGATAFAQQEEAPLVIERALEALSERVGQPVTLGNLTEYRWVGEIYPDTSLGCPQPGETYAQVTTSGFQFLLTFQGVTYDYRVSADGEIVIFCEADGVAAPDAVPVTDEPVMCPGAAPTRLQINEQASVFAEVPALNLRAEADIAAAVVGRIPGGSVVTVLDGPVCGPDIAWWQVDFAGTVGWAAESRGNLYFMQPTTDVAPPPVAPVVPDEVDPTCPGLLAPRLEVNQQARVSMMEAQNLSVRAEPGLAASLLRVIPNGAVITIVDGPSCGPDNIVWWWVDYQGRLGWVAEHDGQWYLLEPLDEVVDPVPVPEEPDVVAAEVCPGLIPTRLDINRDAVVDLLTAAHLNVREEPGLASSVIRVIPNGSVVTVVDGPECGPDNIIWWFVEFDGRAGWVAETDQEFYILAPAT
jgi:uncharacterized protein YraI